MAGCVVIGVMMRGTGTALLGAITLARGAGCSDIIGVMRTAMTILGSVNKLAGWGRRLVAHQCDADCCDYT